MTVSAQELAADIKARGLNTFAIFLIEMHKPFRGSLVALLKSFKHFITLAVGTKRYDQLSTVLASPESVEQLLIELERV